MSETVTQTPETVVVAKIGDSYRKFTSVESVPEGLHPLTTRDFEEFTLEALSQLYGDIAQVPPKKFKDKRVALESLLYQVEKLRTFDPGRPLKTGGETNSGGMTGEVPTTASATVAGASAPRAKAPSAEKFTLLSPPGLDGVLKTLAPQARELVLAMTEIAGEKGSPTFTGADLEAKLNTADGRARLKTRQEPSRILQYYKGKLISSGLIRTS